jgi:hypothetical protein
MVYADDIFSVATRESPQREDGQEMLPPVRKPEALTSFHPFDSAL